MSDIVENPKTVYQRKWRKTRAGRVSVRANNDAVKQAAKWMAANEPIVWARIRWDAWQKADAEIPE